MVQSGQGDRSNLLSILLVGKKKRHQVNILCGSQKATSVPGIFTKVQEIIRLFTALDYMAVGREVSPVGLTVGVEDTAMAERASEA